MIDFTVTPNIENTPWNDCTDLKQLGTITRIGRLPRGTTSGKSTVTVLIEMPDGKRYLAQTTLALMHAAVSAIEAADASDNSKN